MFRVALNIATSMPSTVNKVIEIHDSEDVRVYDLRKLN
jgi:hypothetical protein